MPILDAQGQPVHPSGAVPDIVEQLVTLTDKNPQNWIKMGERFDALLNMLRPHAPQLHGVVAGKSQFDCENPAGRAVTRMLADLAMMCLVMRTKDSQRVALEQEEAAANGASGEVKEDGDGPREG